MYIADMDMYIYIYTCVNIYADNMYTYISIYIYMNVTISILMPFQECLARPPKRNSKKHS